MKREYKGFVAGLLVAGVIAGTIGTAGAVVGRTQAALDYNNIKISLNGQTITPKDANGNTVEPFAINGTTYLPVRAVGDALGLDVDWDGETGTVTLDGTPGELSREDALYIWGLALKANQFKSLADYGREMETIAQGFAASEALLTSGLLSSSAAREIKEEAKTLLDTFESAIEAERQFIDISYSDDQDLVDSISYLENGTSSLRKALDTMGDLNLNFTENYSAALKFASNARYVCDQHYTDTMNEIIAYCDEAT